MFLYYKDCLKLKTLHLKSEFNTRWFKNFWRSSIFFGKHVFFPFLEDLKKCFCDQLSEER